MTDDEMVKEMVKGWTTLAEMMGDDRNPDEPILEDLERMFEELRGLRAEMTEGLDEDSAGMLMKMLRGWMDLSQFMGEDRMPESDLLDNAKRLISELRELREEKLNTRRFLVQLLVAEVSGESVEPKLRDYLEETK